MKVETATVGQSQFNAEVRRLNLHPTKTPGLYVCLAHGDAYEQTFNVQAADEFDSPEARAEYIEELRTRVRGY